MASRPNLPQFAELPRLVGRLRTVVERHSAAIAAMEKTVRRIEQDADFDLGLFDLPRGDRAALKLDNQNPGRK